MKERIYIDDPPSNGRPLGEIFREIFVTSPKSSGQRSDWQLWKPGRKCYRLKTAAVSIAVGAILVAYGGAFLLLGLVYALSRVWPPWLSAIAVGAGVAMIGGIVGECGGRKIQAAEVISSNFKEGKMSHEPAELKAHIKAEGESLKENIEEIESRVKDALDWRIWYKNNTALALGGAAAGGLVVSLLLRRGHGPESEFIDSDEMMDESLMGPNRLRSEPRSVSRVHQVVDNTMSAVLGARRGQVSGLYVQGPARIPRTLQRGPAQALLTRRRAHRELRSDYAYAPIRGDR